jgi:ADP-glucose pyrophosphorylase
MIYTGDKDSLLRELTIVRAIAAMAGGGPLPRDRFSGQAIWLTAASRTSGSSCRKNYHSLMDHLGSGKEWDLHGKNDGLLHPAAVPDARKRGRLQRKAWTPSTPTSDICAAAAGIRAALQQPDRVQRRL